MKIYTKKGDTGQTSLIGGTRVAKDDDRIEAYGTVDELNSFIGLLRDQQIGERHVKDLIRIQDRLFTIGSHLAADPERSRMKLPDLNEEDVTWLEQRMDEMDAVLPPMKSFVLPGGHPAVSSAHVARCVCRRAERLIVKLAATQQVEAIIIRYMNRLSDYLFVLSRMLTKELNAEEIPWHPKA